MCTYHKHDIFFNSSEFNVIFLLPQVFAGNTDRNTAIIHSLKPHIEARCIRFHPRAHNHNIPCLRVELYGCRKGEFSGYAKTTHLIKLVIFRLQFDSSWSKESSTLSAADTFQIRASRHLSFKECCVWLSDRLKWKQRNETLMNLA